MPDKAFESLGKLVFFALMAKPHFDIDYIIFLKLLIQSEHFERLLIVLVAPDLMNLHTHQLLFWHLQPLYLLFVDIADKIK